MSTDATAYAPNARYANRALSHAYWALGVAAVLGIAHFLYAIDGVAALVLGAWISVEVLQVARYSIKSLRAGLRDGRVLWVSISDGAFLSIPAEDVL